MYSDFLHSLELLHITTHPPKLMLAFSCQFTPYVLAKHIYNQKAIASQSGFISTSLYKWFDLVFTLMTALFGFSPLYP